MSEVLQVKALADQLAAIFPSLPRAEVEHAASVGVVKARSLAHAKNEKAARKK